MILIEAWLVLLVFEFCLSTMRFERVRRLAGGTENPAEASDPRLARRINWLVTVASKWHVMPITCLRQTLALQWMLRRRGIASKLRLGVNTLPEFEAHAWLEYEGHQPEIVERSKNSYHLLPVPERMNS